MSDPDLLIHLALDEIHDDTLFDSTSTRRNGTAHNAKIVEDSAFGQCLELQGKPDSYVELPSLKAAAGDTQNLTVMMWVKPAVLDRKMCLVELDHPYGAQNQALGLNVSMSANGAFAFAEHRVLFSGGGTSGVSFTDPGIKGDTPNWYHFASVIGQGGGYYLNGKPVSVSTATAGNWIDPSAPNAAPTRSYLGKSELNNNYIDPPFEGRVAQLRVYKRALTPEEIKWEMEGDRPLQYRYRITHPLDFSMENRDADPTLFMDGHPDGQKMTLHVDNVSSGVIKFAALPDQPPSETNCHFELAFRPGTLAPDSLGKVTVSSVENCWKIASKQWKDPNDRDSLYLFCTKPDPFPATGLTLQLDHLLPDARYGTRTTLVDFRYRNLKSGAGESISGSVQQNLDLVNHLGRRNIPLHVGFAGSHIVLNKGNQPTTLRLRVTNVLPRTDLLEDPLKAAGTGVLRFGKESKLFLSFDEREGTDWALNEPGKIRDIQVYYGKGQATKESPAAIQLPGTDHKPWQWAIPLQDFALEPEEHLEIFLDNVTASGAYGHSNLYLDYRAVPGYWDGRFTCVIDKAPLTYFNGKVGVGVVQPQAELEVKGTLKADSLIISPPTIRTLKMAEGWSPSDGRTPKYYKDSHGIVHLTGQFFFILPEGSEQKKQWLAQTHEVLELPADCTPATANVLRFPSRVECVMSDSSKLLDSPYFALRWFPFSVSQGRGSCYFYPRPETWMQAIGEIQVYLDGISFLAKS